MLNRLLNYIQKGGIIWIKVISDNQRKLTKVDEYDTEAINEIKSKINISIEEIQSEWTLLIGMKLN